MSRHDAETPELAARIGQQFVRHALDLRFPRLADAAEAAAFRVLADPDIADGLRARDTLDALTPVIDALDARHQPREWAGSSTGYVCTGGCGAYPCPDREILDGARQLSTVTA